MMKRMLRFLFLIPALCLGPCHLMAASVKCLHIDGNSACSGGSALGVQWGTSCGGVSVTGVGLCAKDGGGTTYDNTSDLSLGLAAANVNCWCRMVGPAVSDYVTDSKSYGSAADCIQNCANSCLALFNGTKAFREKMLGTIAGTGLNGDLLDDGGGQKMLYACPTRYKKFSRSYEIFGTCPAGYTNIGRAAACDETANSPDTCSLFVSGGSDQEYEDDRGYFYFPNACAADDSGTQ